MPSAAELEQKLKSELKAVQVVGGPSEPARASRDAPRYPARTGMPLSVLGTPPLLTARASRGQPLTWCDSLSNLPLVPAQSVVDTSDGCGAKFEVEIVSSAFEGQKPLARHRLARWRGLPSRRRHRRAATAARPARAARQAPAKRHPARARLRR